MIEHVKTWAIFSDRMFWFLAVVALLINHARRPEPTLSPPPPEVIPDEPLVKCSNCSEHVPESEVETEDAGGIFGYEGIHICRPCKYGVEEEPPS